MIGKNKHIYASGGYIETDGIQLPKETYPKTHDVTLEFQNDFEADVWDTLIGMFHLLIHKNRMYGDAALNPSRIFSKADSIEQLKVRIDDKLNRIKNQQDDEDEDVVRDLMGYLVLLTIAKENLSVKV